MENSMKWITHQRIGLSALWLMVLGMVIVVTSAQAAVPRELKILTWSDYLDAEVVKEFEQKYQVVVKQFFFVSDDERNDILQESSAEGYDLAVVDSPNLIHYRKRGWIAPIVKGEVKNSRYIDPKWTKLFPEADGYAIPYFWGTLGIAYREDLVKKPLTRWQDLFDPAPELHQKIAMLGSSRDLVGMALKAQGYSANSEDVKELKAAEKLIQRQSPFVKSYDYISVNEKSELVTGDIVAAMIFNGDALVLRELNEHIRYTVPMEGTNIWLDYFVILANAQNKAMAADFIDFINNPEVAARQAQQFSFASPNLAAEKYLPPEFLNNPEIYPPASILNKSETYKTLTPRAMKKRHEIFSLIAK